MINLVILWAVLGGAWRRIDGGWLGLPKSICIASGAVLAALPIGWAAWQWVGYWPETLAVTLVGTILVMLFFISSLSPGTSYTGTGSLKRYGPFGLGYWLAEQYWPLAWEERCGWTEFGEGFLGATVFGCLGLLWLI